MPPFVFVRAGVLLTNDEEDLYKILVFWNAKNPSPLGHVRVCVIPVRKLQGFVLQ